MTFCPFCGGRQDVNLRQVHFRDLGTDASLPCPHCAIPLDVIEFGHTRGFLNQHLIPSGLAVDCVSGHGATFWVQVSFTIASSAASFDG